MSSSNPSWQKLIVNLSFLVGPAAWVQDTKSAKLHRRLWAKAWPTKPRWQWYLLMLVSILCWYLCFFWMHLHRCRNNPAFNTLQSSGVGAKRQYQDLLCLGLWYGVRPSDYYRFRLYRVQRNRWLNVVFSQEQATWHRVHSCPPDVASNEFINDKYALESMLREAGIETVNTLQLIRAGSKLSRNQVFFSQDLFIKPNSANVMRGCLLLSYQKESQTYRMSGYDMERNAVHIEGEEEILEFLDTLLEQESFLLQDLLKNASVMSGYAETSELVTLKVITGINGDKFSIAYILMEVPGPKACEWCVYQVDIQTGLLQIIDFPGKKQQPVLRSIQNESLMPEFNKLRTVLCQAHQLIPDIKTLSWDLCVTEKGLCVIEANTGWDLISPQQFSGVPLLESNLIDIYN